MQNDDGGFGGGHAVVVGGSIAGLLAARVLSEHFARVTVVERDRLPQGPEYRKGVPQAHHIHALLKQGERLMERHFPGLLEDLRAAGSVPVDMSADTRWFHHGGWKVRFPSGMTMFSQSRGLLEWKIRAHLSRRENVRLLDGCDAAGLRAAGARVTGLLLGRREGEGPQEELAADLVVDASGRGSRTPQWLERLGAGAPERTEVWIDVGYASRFYRRPDDAPRDWKSILVYPRPGGTRLGALVPMEGGRWMVTLGGWFGDHPPGDEAGFLEFARDLDVPDLHEAVRGAEPVSPIAVHKLPSNLRRRYDRLSGLPDGIAVVGDAHCSFNPIYGQGMTTSAIGAGTLDECLREQRRVRGAGDLQGFSSRFQKRLARRIDTAWFLTTMEDLRMPQARDPKPPWMGLLHWYTAQVHRLTWSDPFVGERFLRVMHLVDPPAALFHPKVVSRVLARAVRERG